MRQGAKIRSTYVNFAQKEKKRLEEEIAANKARVADAERKVEDARAALDSAEAQSRDDLERKKQTRECGGKGRLAMESDAIALFKSLETHRDAVTRLRTQIDNTKGDLDTVVAILDELSRGYNPNGQDMAVKAAVMGYRELVGKMEEPADMPVAETTPEGGAEGEAQVQEKKEPEVKLYTLQKPDGEIPSWEVDNIIRQDLESLLVSSSDSDDDDEEGLLYRLEEYIPDALFDYYDGAREWLVAALQGAGILKKRKDVVNDGPRELRARERVFMRYLLTIIDVAAARERFNTAERELRDITSAISTAEDTLRRLTEDKDFGPQGEWKKLDGTCIDTTAGE
jgi:protein kinase C substrate 80K-H